MLILIVVALAAGVVFGFVARKMSMSWIVCGGGGFLVAVVTLINLPPSVTTSKPKAEAQSATSSVVAQQAATTTESPPQEPISQQRTAASMPPTPAFYSPIPIDISAITPYIKFHKCEYGITGLRLNCVIQNVTKRKIIGTSITYAMYDSQDVRLPGPRLLPDDPLPGEIVQIALFIEPATTRIVFKHKSFLERWNILGYTF